MNQLYKKINSLNLSFEERCTLVCLACDYSLEDMNDDLYSNISVEDEEGFEIMMNDAEEYLNELAEKRINQDIDSNLSK